MSALYTEHAARVYSVVRRLVGDDDLADDVSQDAWVRAFEKLHLFRGDAAFGTWMHRLAVNAALNWLRRTNRRTEVESNVDLRSVTSRTDDVVLNQRVLSVAMDQLPDGYRKVLVLHDIEGMKHEEIARRLGVAIGTSKSQLHKARARMRDLLSPELQAGEVNSNG
jgi:RNA polymerase sigma-70 factor, ECF subfamily